MSTDSLITAACVEELPSLLLGVGPTHVGDLLRDRVGALMHELAATHCELWLRGIGTLTSSRAGRHIAHSWLARPASGPGDGDAVRAAQGRGVAPTTAPFHTFDLRTEGIRGELRVRLEPGATLARAVVDAGLADLVRDLRRARADRVRAELRALLEAVFEPWLWVPAGSALEAEVCRVVQSPLPALVVGAPGTGVRELGLLVHLLSRGAEAPFVEVHCDLGPAHLTAGALTASIERARGGTILLHRVDHCPPGELDDLVAMLRTLDLLQRTVGAPRVLATLGAPPDALPGPLAEALGTVDGVRLRLAPLLDRPETIEALARRTFFRAGMHLAPSDLERIVARSLRGAWPYNDRDLVRTLQRLVADAAVDGLSDAVLERVFPAEAPSAATPAHAAPRRAAPPPGHGPAERSQWLRALRGGDPAVLAGLHPGLRRVLPWLAARFVDPLTLDDAARRAGVSASYLSELLKDATGMSFKPLIAALRVEYAAELLAADPHLRITELAPACGMGDLSHFQRTFRRHHGVSPREYRARQREAAARLA